MQVTTDLFYNQLPECNLPLAELIRKDDLFCQVPGDWHVIITDIKGSTKVGHDLDCRWQRLEAITSV